MRVAPFPYIGGKQRFAKRILELLPEPTKQTVFVEPFCGSASVTLSREPVGIEVINDRNSDIVHFFRVLRNAGEALQEYLRNVPYSRAQYEEWTSKDFAPANDIERAAAIFLRLRAAMFSSQKCQKIPFWVTPNANKAAAFSSAVDELLLVRERLRRVHIENRDALELIKSMDSNETVFYCDPPYLRDTRKMPKLYRHEYTREQHVELLETLNEIQGVAAISGYPSALYRETLEENGWRRVDFPAKCQTSRGQSPERTESVWLHPRISSQQVLSSPKSGPTKPLALNVRAISRTGATTEQMSIFA
jgi:DNA adenine methylase